MQKNVAQLMHSRHRSVRNFIMNLLADRPQRYVYSFLNA